MFKLRVFLLSLLNECFTFEFCWDNLLGSQVRSYHSPVRAWYKFEKYFPVIFGCFPGTKSLILEIWLKEELSAWILTIRCFWNDIFYCIPKMTAQSSLALVSVPPPLIQDWLYGSRWSKKYFIVIIKTTLLSSCLH